MNHSIATFSTYVIETKIKEASKTIALHLWQKKQ